MENKDYTISIELEKPVADVFKAITRDVVEWWGGKDLTGSTLKLNDEFVIHHPGAHYSKQKIVECVPDQKVAWLVTESEMSWLKNNKHEWTDTKMIFELSATGTKTLLRFTHEGLVPGKECYDICSDQGWRIIIEERLSSFVTFGKAMPEIKSGERHR